MSRRGSLGFFGAAVAHVLAVSPQAGIAGRTAKKRCRNRPANCASAVRAYCARLIDPALCEGIYLPCCERFTGCHVQEGISCVLTAD